MDYIKDIPDNNHDLYIGEIIGIIKKNPENKKMNFFIETIMQSNKEEYQLLCSALYQFITPQGGGTATTTTETQNQSQQASDTTASRKTTTDNCDYLDKKKQKLEDENICSDTKYKKKIGKELHPDKNLSKCNEKAKDLFTEMMNTCENIPETENTTTSPIANRLIEKLNQIKSPIQIPHKNKLLIDEQFGLNEETSKDNKYKYYLSFYIIDAINNITVSSSGP